VAQRIFADLTRKVFVASQNGAEMDQPFGDVYHQDILNLSVQPLDSDSSAIFSGSGQYEVLNASGYSISLLVTTTSGTTLAGPFTTWTPDTNGTALTGSADLNTVAMAAAFSAIVVGAAVSTIFWLRITNGSTRQVTIQASVDIYKSAITSGTPSELPITRYPTFEDLAAYVKFAGNPNGATITLTSLSGAQSVELGATDAGGAAANQQT
jgi:hypothetical protein